MSDRRRWFPPAFGLLVALCAVAGTAHAQTCAPAWSASQVYTAGNRASLGATNYQANWWTQGESPATHNGGPGTGQPWTNVGACSGSGGCTVIPSVPTGLTASNVTSSSLTLGWNPSTAGANCTIQYRVFRNGTQVSTVPGTSVNLSGLAAGTTYTFAVGSIDQAGSSALGGAISVATAPSGGTPVVQLYQHCNFGGWVAGFTGTGNFSTADIVSRGGVDNDASAVRIAAGFKATLFNGNGQTGTSLVLNAGDTSCLVASSFNDVVSSLRIEPATTTPAGTRFVPYVDISLATGSQVAANAAAAGVPGVTLAFLVDGGCTAVWGGGLGNVSNATFPNGTSVKSAIDSLTGAGRKVIISWGGAAGSVLSSCGSAAQAQAMYQSVYTAYPNIAGQDFDIEGGVNLAVLAPALAGLKAANPGKSVSLTLPVLPTGLVPAGLNIVDAVHNAGLRPDTINIMAMDYGPANDNGGDMLLSAQQAAQAARAQTGDMIGVTPMIGVNDVATEVFTLQNASAFVTWARGQSYINRLAFWSMSRDNGGCPGQTWASPTCSGVAQGTWQFSSIFNGY
jgi:chitodextrinase